MKKVLFGLFALSTLAFGAMGDNNLYLRAEFTPFSEYSTDNGTGVKTKDRISGAAYGIAVEVTREVMYGLEVGLGTGYQWNGDFDYEADYSGERYPDFNSIPVYVTAKYSMAPIGDLVPYIKGDLGYSFNDLDDNKYFSYEDGLYYGISVGAEIQNLSLEIAYRVNEGEINTDHGKYDIDNSRVMFGAGYKFNF